MRSTILRVLGRRREHVEPEPPATEEEKPAEPAVPDERPAFDELRVGFTAAVSHELRTPLARVLALLDTALLPGSDPRTLVEQARGEVEGISQLVDDVLFLSELETGREVVALAPTRALAIVHQVCESLAEQSVRAGVALSVEGDAEAELPPSGAKTDMWSSRARTTGRACPPRSSRGSSSAFTAPIARARRAGPASGSRSSSTS
jgi:signal transduction histidine kinase